MTAEALAPSAWVVRWQHLLAPGSSVLDVACGSGRHVRWLAEAGHRVTGVDRNAAVLAPLASLAEVVTADLEGAPWPLPGRRFGAVVVTNYLWRPLWPQLLESLDDDGVLMYETFSEGNQTVGKPSNPDFLLQPGELLQAARSLQIVAYECGFLDSPPRFVQRIAAVRPQSGTGLQMRHTLTPGAASPG